MLAFWSSGFVHDELPGLESKGFRSTGKYGIGFFSVFMWGSRVEVTTQRFDLGRADTIVLSFAKGLKERPLLRHAVPAEYIPGAGTRVKVWITDQAASHFIFGSTDEGSLTESCATMAPCLDVTLKVNLGEGVMTVTEADDWLQIDDCALLKRISSSYRVRRSAQKPSSTALSPRLQLLRTEDGAPVGRVALSGPWTTT